MKIAFWRAIGGDDRWSSQPSLAELSMEKYCRETVDADLGWEHCATVSDLAFTDADVIAISSVTDTWVQAQAAIQIAKDNRKFVVVGGPHVTAVNGDIGNVPANVAVVGEGEVAMAHIIDMHRQGLSSHISSVIKRDPLDLSKHGWLPMGVPSGAGSVAMIVSRGCPYRCTFCSAANSKNPCRSFNPVDICNWIEANVSDGDRVSFYDLMLTGNMGWLGDFVEELVNAGAGTRWTMGNMASRTNIITQELHDILKSLRLVAMGVGMETASQVILDKLKPQCTVEDHARAIRLAYDNEVVLGASFIIGTPGETHEDLERTYKFIEKYQGKYFWQAGLFILTPYPGTIWWDYADKGGLLSKDPWRHFHCGMGSVDFSWDDVLYLNEDHMKREAAMEWHKSISELCGRRDPERMI